MPTVYVLVGIPGSGKSTWISQQDWAKDCVIASTDNFIEQYARQQGKTYDDVFEEYMPTAVQLMNAAVNTARDQQKDIIWDQTNINIKSRKRKFQMLKGYTHVAVVFPIPEAAVLERRLAGRVGKTIPKSVIESMISNFTVPTESEGYDKIIFV